MLICVATRRHAYCSSANQCLQILTPEKKTKNLHFKTRSLSGTSNNREAALKACLIYGNSKRLSIRISRLFLGLTRVSRVPQPLGQGQFVYKPLLMGTSVYIARGRTVPDSRVTQVLGTLGLQNRVGYHPSDHNIPGMNGRLIKPIRKATRALGSAMVKLRAKPTRRRLLCCSCSTKVSWAAGWFGAGCLIWIGP